jgi:hypothetical protein
MAKTGMMTLAAVIGTTGLAGAAPPINTQVEGREPNPVVREFHESEVPVRGYAAMPPSSFPDETSSLWVELVGEAWESMLDTLTIPMGRAEPFAGGVHEGM